ncbi:hypothetical protein V5799_012320 [Amblyomma americanum]|uniref:Uncharacterized protein n=1 Tax=Amblyomma americanum TaxID=6943 RepID=A0AAQ4EEI5_AMBAM
MEAGYTQGDIIRLVGGGENHIHVRKQRSAAYASAKLWLGAVVPYAVDPSMSVTRTPAAWGGRNHCRSATDVSRCP